MKLLDNVDDNFLKIRNKASDIRDKIMDWLGFLKYIDPLTKETKFSFMGFDVLLKNVWKWWKNLNIVAKIFVGLGIAVALSKIIKAAKGLITVFGTLFTSLGAFNSVVIALVGVGGGLAMFISGIQKLKEDGITFGNVMETLVGVLLTVGASVLAIGIALGTMTAPLALIISLISLVTLGIVGWNLSMGEQDSKLTQTSQVILSYKERLDELDQKLQENLLQTDAQIGRAQALTESLEGLIDSNGRVVGSEDEVGAKLSALNELLGTEYEITNGQITLNGEKVKGYSALKDKVDNYCKSLRVEAELEIEREKYIETLKMQKELQQRYDDVLKEVVEDSKNYNTENSEGAREWLLNNKEKIAELERNRMKMQDNENYFRKMEEASYLYSEGRYQEAADKLNETTELTTSNMNSMVQNLLIGVEAIPSKYSEEINKMKGQDTSVSVDVDADTSKARQKINQLKQTLSLNVSGVNAKADGGFVNQGELFIAREAGPEMVGQINGHTAVANNDQIVKSIQGGVFNAMMSALSTKDFGGKTVIEAKGDTEGLLNFIEFKQKQRERQYN